MKGKRPLAILVALAMIASVFAVAPVAAQDECSQANSAANLANPNIDTNVNAGNIALNIPVLSPNTGDGDQSAAASQQIVDYNDDFQSQRNVC